MTKKSVLFILKILITIFLFILILSIANPSKIIITFEKLKPAGLVIGFSFLFLSVILNCYRLFLLLMLKGTKFTLRKLFYYHLIGFFFSISLPGSTGGDIARGWYLYKHKSKISKIISTIIYWRLTGILSLLLISGIAAIFVYISKGTSLEFILASIIAIFTSIFLWKILFSTLWIEKIIFFFFKKKQSWLKKINDFLSYCRSFNFISKNGILNMLLALCVNLTIILSWISVSAALGTNISFLNFFVAVPIVSIIKSIPATVGGIGIREGITIMLFSQFGIDKQTAFSLGMVQSAFFLLLGIIGGMLFMFKKE